MEALRSIRQLLGRLAGAPADERPRTWAEGDSTLYAHRVEERSPRSVARSQARTPRQRSGDEGEAYARRYLEHAGLTFVAANVSYRDGEIDLVMRDVPKRQLATPALVFVEVRRRSGDGHGGAAGSVTREKRRRIVAAASHFLVGLGLRTLPPVRFDVVTIDGDGTRGWRVGWLRDAFRDDG